MIYTNWTSTADGVCFQDVQYNHGEYSVGEEFHACACCNHKRNRLFRNQKLVLGFCHRANRLN